MNPEYLGWPLDIKWLFAAVIVVVLVLSVMVIKRAIVGKREVLHHRLGRHGTSARKGV